MRQRRRPGAVVFSYMGMLLQWTEIAAYMRVCHIPEGGGFMEDHSAQHHGDDESICYSFQV
jgi:hypothetical protein